MEISQNASVHNISPPEVSEPLDERTAATIRLKKVPFKSPIDQPQDKLALLQPLREALLKKRNKDSANNMADLMLENILYSISMRHKQQLKEESQ